MFSSTAYEAMYQYLGLVLHSKSIEIISSQKVFLGIILLTFGTLFVLTTLQFFSRYIPGVLIRRRSVPLSKYGNIILCLFLGISFLRVGTYASVKRFTGESWHDNPYIRSRMPQVSPEYKVSILFDLISRTAEETAALISRVVDRVFDTSHSQLEAPNFFFKAIMYGGLASIEDPGLKRAVRAYTDECFDRILPFVNEATKASFIDKMFRVEGQIDSRLEGMVIEIRDNHPYTCLDLKNEVRDGLQTYAMQKSGGMDTQWADNLKHGPLVGKTRWENLATSSFLVNYYLDQHEGYMGVQKGSQLPTTTGKVAQYLNRFFSIDGFLGLIGLSRFQASTLSASRAQEFSENLARAPHVAGFIKMLAIGLFPWLIFFVVAGYYRAIYYWFVVYFSVLLWTPIWTLLYHIMVNISLSADVLQAFGQLNDGISLYSAEIISSRMYHLFAVYSWLQLLTGTVFTGLVLYFLRPAMNDTEGGSTPDFVDNAGKVATAAGAVL